MSKSGSHLRCSTIRRNLAAGSVTQRGSCRHTTSCCLCSRPQPAAANGKQPAPTPPALRERKRKTARRNIESKSSQCHSASASASASRVLHFPHETGPDTTRNPQPATASSQRPTANPQQPGCILPEPPTDFFHQNWHQPAPSDGAKLW